MKTQLHLFLSALLISSTAFFMNAQTNVTEKIVNPGFEDDGADVNIPDAPTGWTWTGNDSYAWGGVNQDAEDTAKTDLYIAGTWNGTIGDVELSQTITGLDNGNYKVTCDLMGGSSNGSGSRMTTQRLFATAGATTKCMLYGSQDSPNYTAANLDVLDDTEEYSFGGYAEFQSDRTPFETLTVEIEVTDGSLTTGIRTNGKGSQLGYDFTDTGIFSAGDGHGWFKVDNFTLTYLGATISISNIAGNDLKIMINNGFVSVIGVEKFEIYNICGTKFTGDQQLVEGIYIIKANDRFKKIIVR